MVDQNQKNETHSTGSTSSQQAGLGQESSEQGEEKKLYSEELLEEDFELEKDLDKLPI